MFFETVKSPGLAHLSYVIGDGDQAVVIDPRRDVDVYIGIAGRHEARIVDIFETHRNEDYVSGSTELAARTGAAIRHGEALDFGFGQPVREGDTFTYGALSLSVLETPGHTDESLSLVVRDQSFGEAPLGVFTGDALFIGAVGRTDFYPDRAEEVAGLLYDSIFGKLLPLGDQAMIWPAHGAGSVCGSGMADREFSTLGYERRHNPALQVATKEEFVRARLDANTKAKQPSYFAEMERRNHQGPALLHHLPVVSPMEVAAFAEAREAGALVAVDVRSPDAWCASHIPGSLALPLSVLSGYGGWFLPYDRAIGLVAASTADVDEATGQLVRMGYENVSGYLRGGLHAWQTAGRPYESSRPIHALELKRWMESGTAFTLLDVRGPEELEMARMQGATEVYLGELTQAFDTVPRETPIVTFCGSGLRAVVASSLLMCHGYEQVDTCLGSFAACQAVGCPIDRPG